MLEIPSSMLHCIYVVRLLRLCFVQRRWVNLFSSHKQLLSAIEKVLSAPVFKLNSEFVDFLSNVSVFIWFKSKTQLQLGGYCLNSVHCSHVITLGRMVSWLHPYWVARKFPSICIFSHFFLQCIGYAYSGKEWGNRIGPICSKLVSRNEDLSLVRTFCGPFALISV